MASLEPAPLLLSCAVVYSCNLQSFGSWSQVKRRFELKTRTSLANFGCSLFMQRSIAIFRCSLFMLFKASGGWAVEYCKALRMVMPEGSTKVCTTPHSRTRFGCLAFAIRKSKGEIGRRTHAALEVGACLWNPLWLPVAVSRQSDGWTHYARHLSSLINQMSVGGGCVWDTWPIQDHSALCAVMMPGLPPNPRLGRCMQPFSPFPSSCDGRHAPRRGA